MLSVPAHPPRFRAWSSFSRDRDVALTRLPLCSLMNRLYYQPTRPSLLFDVSAGSATVHSQHTNTQTFIHNTPIRKRSHKGQDIHTSHTSRPRTSRPSKPTNTPARPRDNRIRGRLNSRSQPRSRTIPAADSEEAAPSEPDPAASPSESASPRLLEGGRRNKARAADASRPAVRPPVYVP